MIKPVQISDGRSVLLDDVDEMTADQGLMLATAVADLLIRSGQVRDDAALSGPHLVQFLGELADQIAPKAQTLHVVETTFDGDKNETEALFTSRENAAGYILHQVVTRVEKKGVTVTPPQRQTLKDSIAISGRFIGAGYHTGLSTGHADDVVLQPIREAMGWIDYSISEMEVDQHVATLKGWID